MHSRSIKRKCPCLLRYLTVPSANDGQPLMMMMMMTRDNAQRPHRYANSLLTSFQFHLMDDWRGLAGLAWLKVDEAGDEVVSICISYYYNSPHRSMHITLVIHSFRPPQPGHRYLWTVRSIDHSFSGHSFFLTWSGARGKLAIRSGEIHKFLEIKWKWGRELSRSFRTS